MKIVVGLIIGVALILLLRAMGRPGRIRQSSDDCCSAADWGITSGGQNHSSHGHHHGDAGSHGDSSNADGAGGGDGGAGGD